LAAAPASAATWALVHTGAVLNGDGPTSDVLWVPSLGLALSFRLDSLSWLLVLMVGGIGTAVFIYCSRYFSERSTGLGRFASVLTAFAGAMLGLVTSDNLIQLYVFWELTTVFSYLLIGHYSDRVSSRRAAMKAILVTTVGGLAMLVGIVILGTEAGTYSISQILTLPPSGSLVEAAIALILVGAISKSALVPFHFWLPAAMAAPTPVSAYLHAAAMVKAGVYLVARFAPAFATLPLWGALVTVLGCLTLVVGGYQALRQNDLKLILAYGTVSQLGLLILLVGSPYKGPALAGVALLGAHALFKGCLFLTVGVIDAATGTRDLRRLSGLGRKLPLTAVVAALATASMIGLMPFSGYVAKESALDAFLTPGQYESPLKWAVIAAFAVGSAFTVAYGLRLWWGAFASKPGVPSYPVVVTPPPLFLIGPPALMAVAGLATGLLPDLGEAVLSPASNRLPFGEPGHLALWSGFNPALAITIGILALGLALAAFGDRVQRWRFPWPASWDGDRIYRNTLRRIDNFAADLTALFQRGSLPFYLGVILATTAALGGFTMLAYSETTPRIVVSDRPTIIAVAILIVAAAVLAARARRRLKAVILTGITGYGTAMTFLLYGAPDLALTQVLVETVTLVVFVLVLRRLPAYFSDRPLVASRWLRIGLGALFGLLVAVLTVGVPPARIHESVSGLFPGEAVAFGGGNNVVNVILVDIRAWDTMGEISVLLVAATGVASLIFLSRRAERTRLEDFDEAVGTIGGTDPDPMATLRARDARRQAPSRSQWLVASRTLAPQRRSVILEVASRILYHTMVVFGVFLLFAGHNAPGGGFVAGLVTGIALVVRYLAGGRYELSAAAPLQPGFLLGSGLVIATGFGLASIALGGEVLQSAIFTVDLPLLGQVKLVTSLLFDFGVYLVVVGLMLDILRSLGAQIDRHGEASGDDSEFSAQALEPRAPVLRRLS
jgi:multicomponent Na+:H+ antiporter subunit A